MSKKKQYGVIPYLMNGGKQPHVVLITSRGNGDWIFPKGNPMKKLSLVCSAELEAWEEAGVKGKVEKKEYTISFLHRGERMEIIYYPMRVCDVLDKWPEMDERDRKIVSVDKAGRMLSHKELQDCLQKWWQDYTAS